MGNYYQVVLLDLSLRSSKTLFFSYERPTYDVRSKRSDVRCIVSFQKDRHRDLLNRSYERIPMGFLSSMVRASRLCGRPLRPIAAPAARKAGGRVKKILTRPI